MQYALVVGCAVCVHEDMTKVISDFGPPSVVYACNDIGVELQQLDHWCTLHPEHLNTWMQWRRERGLSSNYQVVVPPIREMGTDGRRAEAVIDRRVSFLWPDMTTSGSSGLYAAKVAIDDGHERCVLAGIPMTQEGNHITRKAPWELQNFRRAWQTALPFIKDKVRSASGWTRELLGEQSQDWMNHGN